MLPLIAFKAGGCNEFWKPTKPCHVGIYWIALTGYSQMSSRYCARVSVIYLVFLHHFDLAILAMSSIRVKDLSVRLSQVGATDPDSWQSGRSQHKEWWQWPLNPDCNSAAGQIVQPGQRIEVTVACPWKLPQHYRLTVGVKHGKSEVKLSTNRLSEIHWVTGQLKHGY